MTVVDTANLTRIAAEWIANYCKSNSKQSLVIGFNYSCDTFVAIKFCLEAKKIYNISVIVVGSNCDIEGPVEYEESKPLPEREFYLKLADVAGRRNGIIVGLVNKTYGELGRYYDKFGRGAADIFPLLDLYLSEVDELSGEKLIIDKEAEDLEWCSRNNSNQLRGKIGFITNEEPPNHRSDWGLLTVRQKEIVAKLHQREKITRHKDISIKPHPNLRLNSFVI